MVSILRLLACLSLAALNSMAANPGGSDLFRGARPSSAAASSASSNVLKGSSAKPRLSVFAPEDGRAPQNAYGGSVDQAAGKRLAARFRELNRTSEWHRVSAIPLRFETFHPQGLAKAGDRLYLSSVEVIDRSRGEGKAHLFEIDSEGRLMRQITLAEGKMYHPGGIDFDGKSLWISLAEYRPDSRSVIYRVSPETLRAEKVFEFADHLGAVTCDRRHRRLVAASWGSRVLYTWELGKRSDAPRRPERPLVRANGSHYIDYQDCQHLPGTELILFGGLSRLVASQATSAGFVLGGLELLDARDLRPVHQIPLLLWSETGRPMTQNPFHVEATDAGLRFHFIPDDAPSTVYTYEVK